MSIDAKVFSVSELMTKNSKRFIIPRYQRVFSWQPELIRGFLDEIETYTLAKENFDTDSNERPLGMMVVYPNDRGDWEVVDGQQRLSVTTLLARAICKILGDANEPIKYELEKCIWCTNELGYIDHDCPKLIPKLEEENLVAEFKEIVSTGVPRDKNGTLYSKTYRLYEQEIKKLPQPLILKMAARFLNNFYVILVSLKSQEAALDWFEKLNTKYTPLPTVNIFSTELFKDAYARGGDIATQEFSQRWNLLEKMCNNLLRIKSQKKSRVELAFSTYVYKNPLAYKASGIRKAYSANDFALLKAPTTFIEIFAMLDFIRDLREVNRERFSEKALRLAHILLRAESAPCLHALTSFFYNKHDDEFNVNNTSFELFLEKVIAYFIGSVCTGVGSGNLANYGQAAINNFVVSPWNITINHKFAKVSVETYIRNFNYRKETNFNAPFLLTWWLYQNPDQPLLPLDTQLSIEHIFPKSRVTAEPMEDGARIDLLGNLALLEKNVNIRASDFRFPDKKKYYRGFTDSKGVHKKGTHNHELLQLADEMDDFNEKSILDRNERILDAILALLDKFNFLIK